MNGPEDCRLGYEEHDGSRYCFAHGDFLQAWDWATTRRCPTWRELFAAHQASDVEANA